MPAGARSTAVIPRKLEYGCTGIEPAWLAGQKPPANGCQSADRRFSRTGLGRLQQAWVRWVVVVTFVTVKATSRFEAESTETRSTLIRSCACGPKKSVQAASNGPNIAPSMTVTRAISAVRRLNVGVSDRRLPGPPSRSRLGCERLGQGARRAVDLPTEAEAAGSARASEKTQARAPWIDRPSGRTGRARPLRAGSTERGLVPATAPAALGGL